MIVVELGREPTELEFADCGDANHFPTSAVPSYFRLRRIDGFSVVRRSLANICMEVNTAAQLINAKSGFSAGYSFIEIPRREANQSPSDLSRSTEKARREGGWLLDTPVILVGGLAMAVYPSLGEAVVVRALFVWSVTIKGGPERWLPKLKDRRQAGRENLD